LALPSGTTYSNITGQASDSDGSIVAWAWAVVSGSAVLVNANQQTVEVSGLTNGATVTLRLTVTDNAGATGTATVIITVAATAFTPRRFILDIGGNGTTTLDGGGVASGVLTASPDANGNRWNNIFGPANGNGLRTGFTQAGIVDTAGVDRGHAFVVDLQLHGTFVGGYNTQGLNFAGYTGGAVGDYPSSAVRDSGFGHTSAGTDGGRWKITGLDPLSTYTFKFGGSRQSGVSSVAHIKTTAELWTAAAEFNCINNSNYEQAAYRTVSGVSEVVFNIRPKPGADYCHIGLIDYTETRP
jgi:hypothetical protein